MSDEFKISDHFAGKDDLVQAAYKQIMTEFRKFGPVIEEPKKTSIHLVNKSAFAGVATRKNPLISNIKSAAPIKHARIAKSEQVSASRFHQEVKLTSPDEVDPVSVGWLKEAYAISG